MSRNNINIKPLLFLILTLLFLGMTSAAQQNEGVMPVAVPLDLGVWVYLGNEIPRTGHYVIERRKENASQFRKVGERSMPAGVLEMQELQSDYMNFLGELDPVSNDYIHTLWEYIQQNRTLDNMHVTTNLPIMYLLAGNAFIDKTAEKNADYVYQVSFIGNDGNTVSQEQTNPTAQLRQRVFPEIIFKDKRLLNDKLMLTWSVADEIEFEKFNVYRSVFGRDDYQKMTPETISTGYYIEIDTLRLTAIDALGEAPAWYEYLIAPIDAFGNEGEKQGYADGGNMDEYYAPPILDFKAVSTDKDYEVELSWEFENKEYLNGIVVMRSTQYNSGYARVAVLPVEETSFTDVLPVAGENYYYYLLLESAEVAPVPSTKVFVAYTGTDEEPIPPQPVDAVTAENGVQLYWQNENIYAMGFYVYRRSHSDDEFVQISPLVPFGEETYSYLDTSSSLLGNEVYEYVIRTVSEKGIMSVPSDTVAAIPGIKMILAAPMQLRYRLEDNTATIIWDDMNQWIDDLSGYKIFRKTDTSQWVQLSNDTLSTTNYFVDANLESGVYAYAVSASEYFGNESTMSDPIEVIIGDDTLPAPAGIRVQATRNDVQIRWGQISGDDLKVRIYRSEKGQPRPILLATTNVEEEEFVDKTTTPGQLYFYQLSTVNSNGKEGGLSEKVSIRVR